MKLSSGENVRFSGLIKRWSAGTLAVLLGLGMSLPASAGVTDGLVAYWSFDDCSANDVSPRRAQ